MSRVPHSVVADYEDEATGYRCYITVGPFGALNGYVRLPEGHPWEGRHYDEVDVEVHGGLTFAGVPYDQDEGWWFGFDCAHMGDTVPAMVSMFPSEPLLRTTYRDEAYVRRECSFLAAQLAAYADA